MKSKGVRINSFYEIYTYSDENKNSIVFSDGNENFIFSNQELDMWDNDYTFVVNKDCVSYKYDYLVQGIYDK